MDTDKLVRNSFFNMIYKLLNIVFPLVTSMYVARILMQDSIGKVAAAQNIAQYFTAIATMGIPTYGVKVIAQYNIRSKENSKTFVELFVINAILSIISAAAYYLFITASPYFDGKETLYYVVGINVLFNIINVDWFYQGIQEYGYITIRSFIIKLIAFASLIIFVRDESDYIIYALISSFALVLNYSFNIIRMKRYITFKDLGQLQLKKHIDHIFVLCVSGIAVEIYVLADTTMLDIFTDSGVVGFYTMAMGTIRILRSLVVAISAVFLPQMSYLFNNNKKDDFFKLANMGITILLSLSIPCALAMIMVSHDAIIVLYGDAFIRSITTIRILSVSIISVALSNFVGMQIVVVIGKEKITTISTACGACLNIVLNFILIQIFQHDGAAVASVITEALVACIQIILAQKYMKLKFNIKKPMFASLIMCISIYVINSLIDNMVLRLFASCLGGFIIYCAIMYLSKDEFIHPLISGIKEKFCRKLHDY